VNIKAAVTSEVLTNIQQSGGVIVNAFPQAQTIRAEIPVASLETIANLTGVTDIQPAYFCDNASSATNVPTAFGPIATGVKPRSAQHD
jgi:prophage antirepressor-like protein